MLTFYAVVIGLNNAPVSRLRLTWEVRRQRKGGELDLFEYVFEGQCCVYSSCVLHHF